MMIITSEAAQQIRKAAEQGGMDGMPLRIAARRVDDGTVEYMLGFDEPGDEDLDLYVEGIRVLISEYSNDLLKDTTLDFVEITPGERQFIFIPPDKNVAHPTDGHKPDLV
ncbi:MAG: HesB/IscA family protein [Acidiferrobacteraceae bacterium]